MIERHPGLRQMRSAERRNMPKPLPRPTLGQRVQITTEFGKDERKLSWGTITYIHDKHHWYQVTFDAGYRQCYQWGCTK